MIFIFSLYLQKFCGKIKLNSNCLGITYYGENNVCALWCYSETIQTGQAEKYESVLFAQHWLAFQPSLVRLRI